MGALKGALGSIHGQRTECIEWGVAEAALQGQSESGDLYIVKAHAEGTLIGVVDGLGHGPEAAAAARIAAETLETHAHESLISLVIRCHETLKETRGVVIALASFNPRGGAISWLGVGDVEGLLLRAAPRASLSKERLIQRPGVVGYKLPALRVEVLPIWAGDTLILTSDGIEPGFADGLSLDASPTELAQRILRTHRHGADDALVLVGRYLGAS